MSEKLSQQMAETKRGPESREEKRYEAVQDIRERHGILLILCQPDSVLQALGADDADWFRNGLGLPAGTDRLKIIRATKESLPDTVPEQGVIIGGSAHSVYENSPWIKNLKEFTRIVASSGKPLLGVCFGHQIIAEAFGGKVGKGEKGKEVGVVNINLNETGRRDEIFEAMPGMFHASESHGDVIEKMPDIESAAVLAYNEKYPIQSLKIGENVRGVQFHPEVDLETISRVLNMRREVLIKEGTVPEDKFDDFMAHMKTLDPSEAQQVLRNFDRNFVVKYSLRKDK